MSPEDRDLHPDDLLFPYVEDLLAADDRQRVEDHLRGCSLCSDEVRELHEVVLGLRENREAFCPEAWEVYEHAGGKGEADRTLTRHIASCPRCREELNGYRAAIAREEIPGDLWLSIKTRLPMRPVDTAATDRPLRLPSLWERFLQAFRTPALGLAAAAAAILVVVLLYPQEMLDLRVGTSSITWEKAPRPKVAQPEKRPRTAILVFFKDFKESVPQKDMDDLYRGLEPSIEVVEKMDVLPPAVLKQAIKGRAVNPYKREELLRGLKTNLDVSSALLITVSPSAGTFDITCELVNTADGSLTAQTAEKGVREADLSARVRDMCLGIMTRSG